MPLESDELEAESRKYADAWRILPLSSGNYALFSEYTDDHGLPLVLIGTWEDVKEALPSPSYFDAKHEAERAAKPQVRTVHSTPSVDDLLEGI